MEFDRVQKKWLERLKQARPGDRQGIAKEMGNALDYISWHDVIEELLDWREGLECEKRCHTCKRLDLCRDWFDSVNGPVLNRYSMYDLFTSRNSEENCEHYEVADD